MRDPGSTTISRRTRFTAVAAVAAAVGLVTTGATPAHASDALWIAAPYELALPSAPAGGQAVSRTLAVDLYHDLAGSLGDGRVTVDASGLAGIAAFDWPANCTPDGLTAVCDVPDVEGLPATVPGFTIGVHAVPGVPDGAHGVIRYRATAGDLTGYPTETTVSVGSGPDLMISQPPSQRDVQPGSALSMPLTLSNGGNQPVDRVLLWMFASHGLEFASRYGNCAYLEDDPVTNPTGAQALCVIDHPVAPGETYSLGGAGDLLVTSHALYERYDYSVEAYSDQALDQARAGRPFVQGTGPELELQPVPAAHPALAQDMDPSDNYRMAMIDADNTADLILQGSAVQGVPGDVVTASVAVRNRGPAWVASLGAGDPVAEVDVRIPDGTTVVGKPNACRARNLDGSWRAEQLGAPRYLCHTRIYLLEKSRERFPFQLRIDRDVTDSRGTAVTPTNTLEMPITAFDPNLHNNHAEIVVNGGLDD